MPKHNAPLTPKERLFVKEYLVDLNAAAAYRRAGYKNTKNSNSLGPKLLSKPRVATAVAAAMKERSKKVDVTSERVLEELAKVAFIDPRGLFREGGEFIPIHELPPEIAACISGCDIVTVRKGEGEVEHVAKLRLADKLKALELCGKHIGMFREDKGGEDLPMPTTVCVQAVDGRRPASPGDGGEDAA